MADRARRGTAAARRTKTQEARDILDQLGFSHRQANDVAARTFLALLDLHPVQAWSEASNPLRGITPIISFVKDAYDVPYAPNTRETIRDEAVKHFVEAGMVLRNPDNPARPTNSGKTVYQVHPTALALVRTYGAKTWSKRLEQYLAEIGSLRKELQRHREMAMIPVRLPDGTTVNISPGGQNPLIKAVIEEFCPRFTPGATVLYIGDAETKFEHLHSDELTKLGITVPAPAKMPDVVVHDTRRNWLILIEAVASDGPVDGKRRKELKELFTGTTAPIVYVTAFRSRETMRAFLPVISWESEAWVADDPNHLIHFNGHRFFGPYEDNAG